MMAYHPYFLTGNGNWAMELAQILGEDPSKVVSIQLNASVGNLVSVTIERLVTPDEGKAILETVKKYAWTEETPVEVVTNA